jgi:hypothetical protein
MYLSTESRVGRLYSFSKTKSAPAFTVTFTSLEWMSPATVSFEVGFVVPMPTFPD